MFWQRITCTLFCWFSQCGCYPFCCWRCCVGPGQFWDDVLSLLPLLPDPPTELLFPSLVLRVGQYISWWVPCAATFGASSFLVPPSSRGYCHWPSSEFVSPHWPCIDIHMLCSWFSYGATGASWYRGGWGLLQLPFFDMKDGCGWGKLKWLVHFCPELVGNLGWPNTTLFSWRQ